MNNDYYTYETLTDSYLNAQRIQNITNSPIMDEFFNIKNVDFLQNLIIKSVRDISGGAYVIEKQSYDELSIIMNFIFEQNSRQLDNIEKQLDFLNCKVVDVCVPIIINNIMSHTNYIQKHVNNEEWKNIMNYGTFTH